MPKRTLYVNRRLKNGDDLAAWAKENGFSTTLEPSDMHVTIAFSRTPVDWGGAQGAAPEIIAKDGSRTLERLGDGDALVLRFDSSEIENRWQAFRDIGASWDWDEYKPHVTLTYDGADINIKAIEPFAGDLIFGPESFEELQEDWKETISEKSMQNVNFSHEITKVNEELGVIYGWASVTTVEGELVVDSHGDTIDTIEIVKAAHEFVSEARAAKIMHKGEDVGEIVESLVFSEDIQKALGIDLGFEGWFIGMRVPDVDIRKQVMNGELPMFSIGGMAESEEA